MVMKMKTCFNYRQVMAALAGLFATVTASAYDFQEGGVYYNIVYDNVTVTHGDVKYTGNVMIPATVYHDGKTYGVNRIDNSAFLDCNELTSVTINAVIEKIGDRAFAGCKQLATVNLPVGLKEIWTYAFSSCESLKCIAIPGSVQKIESYVFQDCMALESVTFGDADTDGDMRIGDYIFGGTKGCPSLQSVIYGKAVSAIGLNNFFQAGSLESIVSYSNEPPTIDERTFKDYLRFAYNDSIYEHTTLYVPAEAMAAYQAHPVWKKFFHIKALDDISISISYADNGLVKLMAEKGRSYELVIEPAEGWNIHSVTYDGEDVTSLLSADYVFKTPAVTKSSLLNVAFEQTSAGVSSLKDGNRVKVTVMDGQLQVDGVESGELIEVYTVDGKHSASFIAAGNTARYSLKSNQFYVVRVAGKVVKIAL